MKAIGKYILIVAVLISFYSNGFAQVKGSSIRIKDLNPGEEVDSTTSKENKAKYFVNFKIDDPSQADSVFFRFGTTKGGAEVLTETGTFKKDGNSYSVKTQGPSYPVKNTEISCRIKITKKQYRDAEFLSLVVKDKAGLYTNVLTMRLK